MRTNPNKWGRVPLVALVFTLACSDDVATVTEFDPDLEEYRVIGKVEGADHELFGLIGDIAVAADGSVFVLDRQTSRVTWFSQSGMFLGNVSAKGRGPGELAAPVALAVGEPGWLAVLDPGNGRLTKYSFGPGGITYDSSVELPIWSLGDDRPLCELNGTWFLTAAYQSRALHRIGPDGRIDSFGTVESYQSSEYGPHTSMVAARRSGGLALCVEDRSAVLVMKQHGVAVSLHAPTGDVAWVTELTGIRPLQFIAEGTRLLREYDADGSHVGTGAILWDSNTVLLQYSLTVPVSGDRRQGRFAGVESRFLSLADGSELHRTTELPKLVHSQDGVFYAFDNSPYPHVRLLRRRNQR